MRCKIDPKILSLYVDGRLSGDKLDFVRNHISICPACQETLSYISASKAIVGKLRPVEVSPGFDFEFRRRLSERLTGEVKPRYIEDILNNLRDILLPPIPVLIKTAASILIAIGIAVGSMNFINTISPTLNLTSGDVEIYSKKMARWLPAKQGAILKSGDIIKTADASSAELVLKGLYKIRLKSKAELVVIKPAISIARTAKTQYVLKKGELLSRIEKKFKGRILEIETPQAVTTALGTQFALNVAAENTEPYTWLGVLEGTVKVESRYKKEGISNIVLVSSGEKTIVSQYGVPQPPSVLLEGEWNKIKELYQLGRVPQVALLISMSERRARELLRPAALYIYDKKPRTISILLDEGVNDIINAVKQNDPNLHHEAIKKLEKVVEDAPGAPYNANILLFIGAYYNYLGEHAKAIEVFEKVYQDERFKPYASLAKCAEALVYERANDYDSALAVYEEVLTKYPQSPEATLAKEKLKLR